MNTIAHDDGRKRCSWPGTDPLYIAYHDTDWGVPERDSRALFEKLLLDGFQAGLSWITILRKRENFRRAFDGFEPQRVARYGERKVAALMQDAGIVRNRAKIEGAILSARAYLELAEVQDFSEFVWDFVECLAGARPSPCRDRGLAPPLESACGEGFQILRADHRLRLHAGGRHGQRPFGRLLSPRRMRGFGGLDVAKGQAPEAQMSISRPTAHSCPRALARLALRDRAFSV
jgi:DNA-3-methyladenine glycosylase I